MNSGDLNEIGSFFTKDGTDIWELVASCLSPTCTLRNLKTGIQEQFGMNGFTAESFHKIEMPANKGAKT